MNTNYVMIPVQQCLLVSRLWHQCLRSYQFFTSFKIHVM